MPRRGGLETHQAKVSWVCCLLRLNWAGQFMLSQLQMPDISKGLD